MTFFAGEVWHWQGQHAAWPKFHLCVSAEGLFFLVNKPRPTSRKGDLAFSNAAFPFIEPTACGNSIVSCSLLIRQDKASVVGMGGKLKGTVAGKVLKAVQNFVEEDDALPDEEKDLVVEELYDHLGI